MKNIFTIESTTNSTSRIEKSTPNAYRLAQKPNGEIVLQGLYTWQEGNQYGDEWRDIPTVKL